MTATLVDVVGRVLEILIDSLAPVAGNLPWMVWNLFLAMIPLALAARLFRRPAPATVGSVRWWIGCLVFLVFLPNAPYVLTDLIHMYEDVPASSTHWRMAFAVIPSYVVFCAIGFGAYVVSLIWLGRLLVERGWGAWKVRAVECSLHAACAVGIYLGRFVRFNTWDLIADPYAVVATTADLATRISPLAFTTVFFVATSVLYWPAKHTIIAVVAYVRSGSVRRSSDLVQRFL